MRTLEFIVNNKSIIRDPDCDFSGLFPGTEKFIMAHFSFSDEWKNSIKVAAFWSILGAEYEPQELKDGKSCMIPVEALARPAFKVQILGKKGRSIISTNKLTVYQGGGKG